MRTAGGRRFTFVFVPARFAGVVLLFVCTGVAFEFVLPFSARLVLRFAVRLALSFAFLFAGFRLFALALALFAEDELSGSVGELWAFALAFALLGAEYSPSLVGRLISTATVWPTFTISPACGSWIRTVPGFASPVARSARTRKFKPASLMVFSAAVRSLPTMSGTRVSELRRDK